MGMNEANTHSRTLLADKRFCELENETLLFKIVILISSRLDLCRILLKILAITKRPREYG